MLRKLILENYRCYDSKTVVFDEKLTVLKGRNGTGKTTIVEAVGFALFGSKLQRGKANEWISHGQKQGSVTLYIDDIIITRGSNEAIITDAEGETLARNNTGVSAYVEKYYGLTAELFRTSFYIGQKEINSFGALGPIERVKRVERLLRIDRLDDLKSTAKTIVSEKSSAVQRLKERLEAAKFDEADLEEAKEAVKATEHRIEDISAELEEKLKLEGAYQAALKNWREYLRLKKLYNGREYNIEELETQLEDALTNNAKADSNNKLYNEKLRLEKNLASVNVQTKYFTKQIEDLMSLKVIHEDIKKAKDELERLGSEPVSHDNLDDKLFEIKELQNKIALAKNIPESCPTCKQPWPEKQIDYKSLEKDLSAKQLWYNKAVLENKAYNIEVPDTPDMSAAEVNIALESLRYKADYLRLEELSDIEHLAIIGIEPIKRTLDFARVQNDYANKLKTFGDIKEPEPIETKSLKDSLSYYNKQLDVARQELQSLLNAQAIQDEFSELYKKDHAELKKLREFVTFIDKYRKAFGANVIPLLESNVSSIVSFLSEGKFEAVKINEDYSIEDFEVYSGSEQDSISFALRLALAKVSRIGKFSTMLLDEVAASFDNEREKLLLEVLNSQNNQLIYITHGEI